MPGTTATLGGITFGGAPDANGVSYRLTKIEGWTGTPDVRQTTMERVAAEGQVLLESFYTARALVLTGMVVALSASGLWTAMNALAAAADLVTTSGLLVVNEPTPKQMTVRLSGRCLVDPVSDRLADFQIPLLAVDPRKYAVANPTVPLL